MRTKENKWTEQEEQWLIENYPTLGAKRCSEVLNKNINSICGKRQSLQLKFNIELPKNEFHKICRECKNEKPFSFFNKAKANKDNLSGVCKPCASALNKIYTQENKAWLYAKNKKYRQKNRSKINQRARERRVTDVNFKLRDHMSSRIRYLLSQSNAFKSNELLDLIGCSISRLKNHIESQFDPQMTWENHGNFGWNYDHVVPCAMFDLTQIEEQFICFNYSNLSPRWATTTIAKEHNSNQIGNFEKGDDLVDNSYYHLLTNPS